MTALLDANVLIALTVEEHVHHDIAARWFSTLATPFATCPLTQGALLRTSLRTGATAAQALDVLGSVTSSKTPRHEFWPDDLSYPDVSLRGVVGHRQVTDAYLAGLARNHQGRVVTLDRGLALLHEDVVDLLPMA